MLSKYMSLEAPAENYTENTLRIGRNRNHNVRMDLNEK